MVRFVLLPAVMAVVAAGCSCSETTASKAQTPPTNTQWHVESTEPDRVSWVGSYPNAINALHLRSHTWKVIGPAAEADRLQWGFQAVVEFPQRSAEATAKPIREDGRDPRFMPIEYIEYQLFDADHFLVASLVLDVHTDRAEGRSAKNHGLGINEGDTKTFQLTGTLSKPDVERAAYGRIKFQAGYLPVV